MKNSFKTRYKIIQDEILDQKGDRIYIEQRINKLMKDRYKDGLIDTNSTYIYEKMNKLIHNKLYIEVWGIPGKYVKKLGYINVIDLHRKLTEIIRVWHRDGNKKLYNQEELDYIMFNF